GILRQQAVLHGGARFIEAHLRGAGRAGCHERLVVQLDHEIAGVRDGADAVERDARRQDQNDAETQDELVADRHQALRLSAAVARARRGPSGPDRGASPSRKRAEPAHALPYRTNGRIDLIARTAGPTAPPAHSPPGAGRAAGGAWWRAAAWPRGPSPPRRADRGRPRRHRPCGSPSSAWAARSRRWPAA